MTLQELFDAAIDLGVDVTLFEEHHPGAVETLLEWAAARGMTVTDQTHVVEEDHPIESWRGLWVSTVKVTVDRNNRDASITVHRAKPAAQEAA